MSETKEVAVVELPKELVDLKETAKGLSVDKADQILMSFAPAMTELTLLSEEMKKVNFENPTDLDAEIARKIRLKLVPVRTGTGRTKDALKADIKIIDKLIMSAHNLIVSASEIKEKALEEVEKFRQRELERLQALKLEERRKELEPYNQAFDPINVGAMSDDVFSHYLTGVKANYEAQKEAERKAEEQRLEQERISQLHIERKESLLSVWSFVDEKYKILNFGILSPEQFNDVMETAVAAKKSDDEAREKERAEAERLRKENEAAAAKAKAEREAAEAKLREEQEKARKEREAAELKAKQEREALQKQLDDERAEKERIERERREKEESERKRIEAEEKARKAEEAKAAKAPKKKKLAAWIEGLTTSVPVGLEQDETANEILEKFNGFKVWAKSKIENL